MGNVKGSAALLIAAVAIMMFLTGCETTKHAETMSAEELATFEKASGQGLVASEDTEQGAGKEESLSVGDVSGTGTGNTSSSKSAAPLISDFSPQLPPSPTLQGAINAEKEATGSGFTGSTADPGSSPGSSGYEDEQFARALMPMSGDEAAGLSGHTDANDEVLRIPDHAGVEEPTKPLEKADLREGGLNGVGIELHDVYFDFDQFVIRQDAVSTLQANAQFLNAKYQNSGVLIEGHCDERGTSEYNLVLGERRARAAKDYLTDLGVSGPRIQIISYGKERPSCTESKASCWQQNRRDHFVLR